jgi:hypothetical protein
MIKAFKQRKKILAAITKIRITQKWHFGGCTLPGKKMPFTPPKVKKASGQVRTVCGGVR